MPIQLKRLLPAELSEEVATRYATLGEKYLTDRVHTDERRINGMMDTNRLVNANEEIIDAVFCMLGQIFKDTVTNKEPSDNIYAALEGMIKVYQILKFEDDNGDYS